MKKTKKSYSELKNKAADDACKGFAHFFKLIEDEIARSGKFNVKEYLDEIVKHEANKNEASNKS